MTTPDTDTLDAALLAMLEIAEKDKGGEDGQLSEQAQAAINSIADEMQESQP